MGAKQLRIRYKKINGFIKNHNEIRHLVFFDCDWFDKVCDRMKYLISEKGDRMKYLISEKGGITDSINHDFGKLNC